jgi:hypothetical protein
MLYFSKQAPNPKVCLDLCRSNTDCNWFSFSPVDKSCHFLKNCALLDLEICQDCKSGQRNCHELQCDVRGECTGIIIESSSMTYLVEDCLQLCKSTPGCAWFTFYQNHYQCFLFESCSTIVSTCETCVSGQRACRGVF